MGQFVVSCLDSKQEQFPEQSVGQVTVPSYAAKMGTAAMTTSTTVWATVMLKALGTQLS